MTIHQVLIKYWGFNSFRPLQEDIINSVLDGKDTLALLPTGGGKSICFQVPAMVNEGICIVISPLIALMKDQVLNLNNKGIKAMAIYSGMHPNEIDIAFDNCAYGDFKFLYISPERLASQMAIDRIKKMNVNLLAVDESHCISQWGYDFRPPYLEIAKIRQWLPKTPILALTATATPEVVIDIQNKLEFATNNVFQKSFNRENLTYFVIKEEDKLNRLLRIAKKIDGSAVVYVRNRRKTAETAKFLEKNNISADYYHAGVSNDLRDKKQEAWIRNKKRIMVATNAFGMGIDKPDVRFVVHLDPPDTIEAYFQEAGRAGRDEKKASAIFLYADSDIKKLKQNFTNTYPEIKQIKAVYNALGNYFNLAIGSGNNCSFDFDLNDFCNNYQQNILTAYNSIKFLEKEGYLLSTDAINTPSKIKFTSNKNDLYKFQLKNINYDGLLKTILRSYSGLFSDYIKINENEIAKKTGWEAKEVIKALKLLESHKIVSYIPAKKKAQIIYCKERMDIKNLLISKEIYDDRKKTTESKLNAVIHYIYHESKCRNQLLLSYFGEKDSIRCGKCDICLGRNKLELNEIEFDIVLKQIKPALLEGSYSHDEILNLVSNISEEKSIKVIQWLIENHKIVSNSNKKLTWHSN